MNKKVQLLTEALRRIRASRNPGAADGICHYLFKSYKTYGEDYFSDYKSLTKRISKRLGQTGYLYGWLRRRRFMTNDEMDHLFRTTAEGKRVRQKLKATRIAWLKSLIKEHS